ncbi:MULTISPECIES: protoporphyrinogen oxidase [unclassified Crossiella]|uniref:protoporphyrinogen oxidase n=1 Tax=unclassified Crossiella TaxID=2620835 RepID=UPI001FFF30E9|nr:MULTISPECIES: protoporphyrinogen oxidase [unclassified Crossiella]MCK2240452.1 protoporphyrinogen oxidase [Crossiella sp. S99.2]MCK2253097.1 protoporphyrinogen oxidase [Crossiella sp. S99.1]
MTSAAQRVAVIGGGIAGLTVAHRLRGLLGEQVRVTVLEQTDRLGGKLRTEELAGGPVDVGAEAFVTRRTEGLELVTELGLTAGLRHPLRAAPTIRAGGATRPLPARTFLGVPAEPALLREVLSADGFARAMAEPELPPLRPDGPGWDATVADLLGTRFGPEVVDRLAEPLLGGVYAGRAEGLGVRATMAPLVDALERGAGSLTAAAAQTLGPGPKPGETRPPVFGTLTGGLGDLVARLAETSGAELRLGVTVRGLRRTAEGWRLELGSAASPEFLDADAVVLAVPAPAARKLLAEDVPAAAAAYGRIEVSSMAVLALALPPDTELPAASGVLLAVGEKHTDGTPFTAKAFTFSSRKWGHFAERGTLLRASVGRFGETATLQRDDAELIAAVRADLAELTGVRAEPVDSVVRRWGGGLPQYALGHTATVAAIEAAVAEVPGLAVAGASLHGVGIPACIATGQAAATRVATHLAVARRPTGASMGTWPA